MNLGLTVLFVLVTTAAADVSRQQYERGVLRLVERWKNGEVGSLPIRLPSLTPLTLPALTSHDERGLFTMSISEAKVYGLQSLSVTHLSTNPSGWMSVAFNVPLLQIRADSYHLKMEPIQFFFVVLQLLNDRGAFGLDVTDVEVRADVNFGASGGGTAISYLDINFSVGGMKLYLTGSTRSTTEKVRRKFWNRLQTRKFKDWIQNIVLGKARSALQGYTPQQLVNMISSN